MNTLTRLNTSRLIDDFFNWGFDGYTRSGLDRLVQWEGAVKGFPHYNIVRENANNYTIELALAGYHPEDISVEIEKDILYVTGKVEKTTQEVGEYAYKGITSSSFTRAYRLHPGSDVGNVKYENGILSVPVHVPEIENVRKALTIEVKTSTPKVEETTKKVEATA